MTGDTTLKGGHARLGKAMEPRTRLFCLKMNHYAEAEAEVQRMNADCLRLAQELDNRKPAPSGPKKPPPGRQWRLVNRYGNHTRGG